MAKHTWIMDGRWGYGRSFRNNEKEIENRREFEVEHQIIRDINFGRRNKFYHYLWDNNLERTGNYDHNEWYLTLDGYVIWISSPYENYDEEYASNTIFGVPFQKTKSLYNPKCGGHSYFKKIPKHTLLNKTESQKWSWKSKEPKPICSCGQLAESTYDTHTHEWNKKYRSQWKRMEHICLECSKKIKF